MAGHFYKAVNLRLAKDDVLEGSVPVDVQQIIKLNTVADSEVLGPLINHISRELFAMNIIITTEGKAGKVDPMKLAKPKKVGIRRDTAKSKQKQSRGEQSNGTVNGHAEKSESDDSDSGSSSSSSDEDSDNENSQDNKKRKHASGRSAATGVIDENSGRKYLTKKEMTPEQYDMIQKKKEIVKQQAAAEKQLIKFLRRFGKKALEMVLTHGILIIGIPKDQNELFVCDPRYYQIKITPLMNGLYNFFISHMGSNAEIALKEPDYVVYMDKEPIFMAIEKKSACFLRSPVQQASPDAMRYMGMKNIHFAGSLAHVIPDIYTSKDIPKAPVNSTDQHIFTNSEAMKEADIAKAREAYELKSKNPEFTGPDQALLPAYPVANMSIAGTSFFDQMLATALDFGNMTNSMFNMAKMIHTRILKTASNIPLPDGTNILQQPEGKLPEDLSTMKKDTTQTMSDVFGIPSNDWAIGSASDMEMQHQQSSKEKSMKSYQELMEHILTFVVNESYNDKKQYDNALENLSAIPAQGAYTKHLRGIKTNPSVMTGEDSKKMALSMARESERAVKRESDPNTDDEEEKEQNKMALHKTDLNLEKTIQKRQVEEKKVVIFAAYMETERVLELNGMGWLTNDATKEMLAKKTNSHPNWINDKPKYNIPPDKPQNLPNPLNPKPASASSSKK